MMKGIQVALAILLFSFLPGAVGDTSAQTPSPTSQSTCHLPSYTLVSHLKTARRAVNSNGSDQYVPAIFTSAKESNGALSASIGVGIADESGAVVSHATPSPLPQPLVSPIPQTPATPSQTSSGGLNADTLFAMVNEHRAKIGLPPFQQDSNLAAVAQSRAPELQGEMYGGGGMHAGFYNRQLPYWATENMISQQTETEALNWWLNSSVHRGAIEGNYTYASVACEGKNCAMIFTSFTPKQ